jgi:hypothetical protein
MRVDNLAFADFNRSEDKDPRYVIEIEFDPDNTAQTWYLTSHDDCAVPPTAGGNVLWSVIRAKGISSSSQKLTPIKGWSSIGSIKISLVDANSEVTNLISTQLAAGLGLRHKVVRAWMGGLGLVWDEYIQTDTQIADEESFEGGVRDLNCSDVQRLTRKDVFDKRKTTLRASITDADTVLPVYDASEFEFNQHGSSYTDAPNEKVIYVDVDKETVRAKNKLDSAISIIGSDISFSSADDSINSVTTDLSGLSSGQQLVITGSASNDVVLTIAATAPTANKILVLESLTTEAAGAAVNVLADVQFYNCTRGALNTRAVAHEVDVSDAPDRRTAVTENIYIELPLVKMLLALLTGNVYGQADPFPSNWHLGIDTQWVSTSSFVGVGNDLWDTSDDALGFMVRFEKLKKRDGKKFIEGQLLRLAGCFQRVRNDGQLELRRFARIAPDSAYVVVLSDNNVEKLGRLKQDFKQVHNVFTINWNRDINTGKLNRHQTLFDPDSLGVHGAAPPMEFNFEGLTGYTHTQTTLAGLRDSARDMHAGPPLLITVKAMPHLNILECGDIVRYQTDKIRDPITGGDLDRSFMILGTRKNWMTGEVVLILFGSSQAASPIADAESTVLPDSAYQVGTDITTVTTGTLVSGVWHITGDSTLTGHANANNVSAIYSFNGDVVLDADVNLFIDDNVQIRAKTWTRNGTVNGVGRGIPGAVPITSSWDNRYALGTPGAIGSTESAGSLRYRSRSGGGFRADIRRGGFVEGAWTSLPVFDIRWDGNNIVGLPNDMRGSSGSTGGWVGYGVAGADGGGGGDGAAALIIIAQNVYEGAGGSYNLSGGDGLVGGNYVLNSGRNAQAGSGAGGSPSGLLIVIDGPGFAFATLVANQGNCQTFTRRLTDPHYVAYAKYGRIYSYHLGMQVESHADANLRIQHLRDNLAAEPDPPTETSRALSINVQQVLATANSLNLAGLEIGVNPPSDSNYKGSLITVAAQGTNTWIEVGRVFGNEEVVHWVVADGSTYLIRAHPIALNDVVSKDYVLSDPYTVPVTAGQVVIGAGNQIMTSETVGEASNGEGIVINANAIIGYNAIGEEKTKIDGSTGKITAVDVNLTGMITALAGQIGGWNITSTLIRDASGNFALDSANTRLRLQNGANTIDISPAGIVATDSVLGTTLNIPTDGSAPTFASGIINSTVFNITSAGILETSATAGDGSAAGQGIRINDLGIRGWAANDAAPKFNLTTEGYLTALGASITGIIQVQAGSNVAIGADVTGDNVAASILGQGALALENTVDWQTEITGSGIPDDGADVTQNALIAGTTITGGGIILSAGGSIKSVGKIEGAGLGVLFGRSGSNYVLDVGNHSTEKFIWFDGTDLLLGEETLIGGKVLYSGAINNTGAGLGLPSGWTSTKISTGYYRVTHNLGLTNPFDELHITLSIYKHFGNITVGVFTTSANDFTVKTFNSTAAADQFFYFHAHYKKP